MIFFAPNMLALMFNENLAIAYNSLICEITMFQGQKKEWEMRNNENFFSSIVYHLHRPFSVLLDHVACSSLIIE